MNNLLKKQSLRIKKIFSGMLVCLMLVSSMTSDVFASEHTLNQMIQTSAQALKESFDCGNKNLLSDTKNIAAGSSASDWIAMVLAFSGEKDGYRAYLEDLTDYVTQCYEEQGVLDEVKATEYHRIALTMLALGGDPTRISGKGQQTIDLVADGTWNFHTGNPGEQGTNGLIYALLLLDAENYETDTNFRQQLIADLLEKQTPEGGFYLNESLGADIDITAMALQALAPYKAQDAAGKAIQRGSKWLSSQLSENGTYVSYNAESVESIAQVILALCALGIDPAESEEFTRNGQSLLDSLQRFRLENGMYKHEIHDESANTVATYQSLLALEAVQKLRTEGTWIFQFSDYEFDPSLDQSGHSMILPAAAVGILAAAAGLLLIIRKQKKNG